MMYVSTRGGAGEATFAEALLRGLAPDGGLYAPAAWPRLDAAVLARATTAPYAETAVDVLTLFDGGSLPAGALRSAAEGAQAGFTHEAVTPLVQLEEDLWLLELFHGPTAAFKDLAMQLMARLTEAALSGRGERLLLLTATSGDTGAAAVHAFAGMTSVDLVVLHPLDRVSPVQRRQMTTVEAPNVLNLGVRGDFDACQALVKALLADADLRARSAVSSVNSINWGRLAGQVPYYVRAAEALAAPGRPVSFVVPTGNFGDAFAGWAARRIGAPLGRLTAAVNVNDSLAVALNEGRYRRAATTPTASVSMDVQAPSNFERLVFEAAGRDGAVTAGLFASYAAGGEMALPQTLQAALRREVAAVRIDEARTADAIAHAWRAYGRMICPHTAVALAAALDADRSDGPVVVLATAHPGKFPDAVAAALGFAAPEPEAFSRLRGRPERLGSVEPELPAVKAALQAFRAGRPA
jgi:threonine synthase